MTETNPVVQNVITDAERVIELLGGDSELQQKFAFVKANAKTACDAVNATMPDAVSTAVFQIGDADVTNTNVKSQIISNLNTIVQFLKTGAQ